MCSKIYDIEDLIDIREYVRQMEEEQRKKAEQEKGETNDDKKQGIGIGMF